MIFLKTENIIKASYLRESALNQMKKALLLLTFMFFIPQSFAQNKQTVVASIKETPDSERNTLSDPGKNSNFFNSDEIYKLELMYENTYDFLKTRYSYYKQLDILNTDFTNINELKDSVTFLGAILPFVTLPDNNDETSVLSGNGLSFFFFYKKQF